MVSNPNDTIGIYVHIPFCISKCPYCDFYSVEKAPENLFDEFLAALVTEIRLAAGDWQGSRRIDTLYFGGGTPSLLSPDQIRKIYRHLKHHFDVSGLKEWTLEVNPGTVDGPKLKAFGQLGVNRLSIGVQALQDRLLRTLGRIHTAREAKETIDRSLTAGFENINVDLLFGIPGQAESDWEESLRYVKDRIPHLSLYNLTYHEGTPYYRQLRQRQISPVPEELEKQLFALAEEILPHRRYEISNYALPGFECMHNLGYWNGRPYLGLGPSAHSYDGNSRWWNTASLETYIQRLKAGFLPREEVETPSAGQQMVERIYLQLRQQRGMAYSELAQWGEISTDQVRKLLENRFGSAFNIYFRTDADRLAFTKEGFWLSDELIPQIILLLEKNGVLSVRTGTERTS